MDMETATICGDSAKIRLRGMRLQMMPVVISLVRRHAWCKGAHYLIGLDIVRVHAVGFDWWPWFYSIATSFMDLYWTIVGNREKFEKTLLLIEITLKA